MRLEELISRVFGDLGGGAPHRPMRDFAGAWRNEYGSSMRLSVDGSAVSGSYTSAVSTTGDAITGPVTGFVAGDVISFTVLWPSRPAKITAWVGQIVEDERGERLETLWQMIVNVPDAQRPDSTWTTIHAGADHFHRA